MALHFNTSTPKRLLAAYRKAIDDGHVDTWSYDSDGDFTHTAGTVDQAGLATSKGPARD